MLPTGPRSTFRFPSTVQPGSRDLARQILASINAANVKANEVRTGLVTTGCDGQPVVNPLDGTNCNGSGGTVVLFNPATRKVFGTLGKVATAGPATVVTAPALSCATVLAALKARRRFTDNLGNVYGPTGAWLSSGATPATLNADYVHRLATQYYSSTNGSFGDPPIPKPVASVYLAKITGVLQSTLRLSTANVIWSPALDDITGKSIQTHSSDLNPPTPTLVLEDATFGGIYVGTEDKVFWVTMNSLGTPDTFSWTEWYGSGGLSGTAVPITGGQQILGYGLWVQFGATSGHSLTRSWPAQPGVQCGWLGSIYANNDITRHGVAARGTITTATACVNSGFPNNNVLLTSEDDCVFASHALVVRDPDSLVEIYRKPLVHDGTGYQAWGAAPPVFSFSTNDEGLFFMHAYTVPVLTSTPDPYPGAEFGAPNTRKVAVVSVNPLTFEPTINELITLEDNEHTRGSTFAVAMTVP